MMGDTGGWTNIWRWSAYESNTPTGRRNGR